MLALRGIRVHARPVLRIVLGLVLVLLARTASADVEALAKNAPGCESRPTCLGLALHVAEDDKGPVAKSEWLHAQIATANRHFAKLDVGFKVISIDALPKSAMRIDDATERTSLGTLVKGPVIHVFVTGKLDDIDLKGKTTLGVAWRAGVTKFVILSTEGFDRVLAHELGHVFWLPHSTYEISIMNKTPREKPPWNSRRFADEEFRAMKPKIAAMLKSGALVNQK